jgi:hypothetical protein
MRRGEGRARGPRPVVTARSRVGLFRPGTSANDGFVIRLNKLPEDCKRLLRRGLSRNCLQTRGIWAVLASPRGTFVRMNLRNLPTWRVCIRYRY